MARLPIPGSDDGKWGDVLNDFLKQVHKTDGKLKDNTVTAATLAPGAVDGSAVKSSSITGSKIKDEAITEAKLDSALASKVNAAAGNPTMGGDLSGTASNAQIVAGAVGSAELASQAVTTAKLADVNVTTAKLANGAVDASKLATGAVTTVKIADGTISEAKLDTALASKVNGGAAVANGSLTPAKLNSDVPANGELLSYNAGNFQWITAPAAGGGGESNTASNVGTGGVGVYKQKTGVDLEFKRVRAGSSKVTVTDNTGNNTVDLDVDVAQLGLTKASVGLGNVDNTSDANKPISTATQTALNAKAPLASPTFTGNVVVPTPTSGTHAATKAYVDSAVGGGGGGSGYTFNFRNVNTASATAANNDCIFADTSSTGITITLPAPVANGMVRVKRLTAAGNGLQVAAPNGSYIDAVAVGTDTLNNQYDSRDYWSDGNNWYR